MSLCKLGNNTPRSLSGLKRDVLDTRVSFPHIVLLVLTFLSSWNFCDCDNFGCSDRYFLANLDCFESFG